MLCTVVVPCVGPGTWSVLTDGWYITVERCSPALPVQSWLACQRLSRIGIGPAGLYLGSLVHSYLGNRWTSLIRTLGWFPLL